MSHDSDILNINVVEIRPLPNAWTKEEHAKMLGYMEDNRKYLMDNIKRNIGKANRSNKAHFFVNMAAYIGTKSDKQCKSRYQKKESQLLKDLNFSVDLVDEYVKFKKDKSKKQLKQRESSQSTDVCNSMMKHQEPACETAVDSQQTPSNFITSFEELKAIIISEFMPRIQNEDVRVYLHRFIQSFPSDENMPKQISSVNMNPFRMHQPSIGFSIDIIQDPEVVFLED